MNATYDSVDADYRKVQADVVEEAGNVENTAMLEMERRGPAMAGWDAVRDRVPYVDGTVALGPAVLRGRAPSANPSPSRHGHRRRRSCTLATTLHQPSEQVLLQV